MTLPKIVSQKQWESARKKILKKEKTLTRRRDALNVERREMPMVEVTKDYRFEGPHGEVTLLDLFDGRDQLILMHFMFDPTWDDGCPSCTAGADEMSPGLINHLNVRNTSIAYVSRAPIAKIEAYKAKRGWTFPWVSSYGSDFNYDFHVTLDRSQAPVEYNFRDEEELAESGQLHLGEGESMELPGRSHFVRDGERIFHTNSIYARGLETIGGSYYLLDETTLGRQEDWEEPKGRAIKERTAEPNFRE
jgi:predicted dithiol-disulfide oxidoreductase (DUF899 family)